MMDFVLESWVSTGIERTKLAWMLGSGKRWQAGEKNKERLKDILEEISRRSDWPGGSVERIVGDDYASCMDEARAEASGGEIRPERLVNLPYLCSSML